MTNAVPIIRSTLFVSLSLEQSRAKPNTELGGHRGTLSKKLDI